MGVSLYELKGNFLQALRLEVATPEDADAMVALIDEAAEDIENKCINIGYLVKTLEYEAATLREEEKRLADRRRARENKADRLKQYAFDAMKLAGIDSAETVGLKVSIAKTPPSLKVLDEASVPEEFWKIERSLMRRELLAHVKEHPECDYAYAEGGETLRIK